MASGGLLDIPNVLADVHRNDNAEENGNKDGGVRKFFGRLFQSKSQSSLSPKANGNHTPAIIPRTRRVARSPVHRLPRYPSIRTLVLSMRCPPYWAQYLSCRV
jgi:hypothetical protein